MNYCTPPEVQPFLRIPILVHLNIMSTDQRNTGVNKIGVIKVPMPAIDYGLKMNPLYHDLIPSALPITSLWRTTQATFTKTTTLS